MDRFSQPRTFRLDPVAHQELDILMSRWRQTLSGTIRKALHDSFLAEELAGRLAHTAPAKVEKAK